MTIRHATSDDRVGVEALALAFLRDYSQAEDVPTDQIEAAVDRVLVDGTALVLEDRGGHLVGLLGLIVAPHPLTGVRTGFEVAWYVKPEARGGSGAVKLVREAEVLATAIGAQRLQIGAPSDSVGLLLTRLGYRVIETTYAKDLR